MTLFFSSCFLFVAKNEGWIEDPSEKEEEEKKKKEKVNLEWRKHSVALVKLIYLWKASQQIADLPFHNPFTIYL